MESVRAATLSLDGQRAGGEPQRPALVNVVTAVQMMNDSRCADHRVPREVEFFEQVEDACTPMVLRPILVEEDGLELAQLARDLSHLRGVQACRIGKDGQAVAAIGPRGEHIDELELHRNDATWDTATASSMQLACGRAVEIRLPQCGFRALLADLLDGCVPVLPFRAGDVLSVAGPDLRIMVYTAEPGTEDAERLALLVVRARRQSARRQKPCLTWLSDERHLWLHASWGMMRTGVVVCATTAAATLPCRCPSSPLRR
jgi:hypothetical protein